MKDRISLFRLIMANIQIALHSVSMPAMRPDNLRPTENRLQISFMLRPLERLVKDHGRNSAATDFQAI